MTILKIDGKYNQPQVLPPSIDTLYISEQYTHPLIIPNNTRLYIGKNFNWIIVENIFQYYYR